MQEEIPQKDADLSSWRVSVGSAGKCSPSKVTVGRMATGFGLGVALMHHKGRAKVAWE